MKGVESRPAESLDHSGMSAVTMAVIGLCLAALIGGLGWLDRTGSISQTIEVVPTSVAPVTTAPPTVPTTEPDVSEEPERPRNLGVEWRSVALDDIEGFERGPHQQLVVDGDALYISSGTALYVSDDLQTATRLALPNEGEIYDLAVDDDTIAVVSAPSFVELGRCNPVGTPRVHVSTDGAVTWTEVVLPVDNRELPAQFFWPSDFVTVAVDGRHVVLARHRLPPLRNASCIMTDADAAQATLAVQANQDPIAEAFTLELGVAVPTEEPVSAVASAGGAIIGRQGGASVMTVDGGDTWTVLPDVLIADTTALFNPVELDGLISWTYDGGRRWHAVADTLGRTILDLAEIGGRPYALTESDDGQYLATPTPDGGWISQPVADIVDGMGAATPVETIWSMNDQIVFNSFTRTGHILLVGSPR